MTNLLWKGVGIISIIAAVFSAGAYYGGERASVPLRERITKLESANLAAIEIEKAESKRHKDNANEISKRWNDKYNSVDAERKRLLLYKGNKDSQNPPSACAGNTIQWSNELTAFTLGCTQDAIIAEACKEYVTINRIPVLE